MKELNLGKGILILLIIILLTFSGILVAKNGLRNDDQSPQDYIAEAIAKGNDDNTGDFIKNIQTDDDIYYRVRGTCIGGDLLFIDEFNVSGMAGSATSAILHVQYLTDTNYDRKGYIRWALDYGSLQNTTIQPHQTEIEVIESYDLFAQGVNTLAEIESLNIEFSNPGGWMPAPTVYFEFIWIEVGFEIKSL